MVSIFIRCGAIAAIGLMACLLGRVNADAQTLTTTSSAQPSATATPTAGPTDQQSQITDLQNRVNDLEEISTTRAWTDRDLEFGILSLGGALGVVFPVSEISDA